MALKGAGGAVDEEDDALEASFSVLPRRGVGGGDMERWVREPSFDCLGPVGVEREREG